LREEIPEIAIRTTMIVGHPGETASDHKEMLDFIEEFKFTRLGVFTYSDEDGTKAATMEKKVSLSTAIKRMNAVMEKQKYISEAYNQSLLGQRKEVIIDSYDEQSHVFIGRTKNDAPEIDNEVIIAYHDKIHIADIINVKIENFAEYEIFGKLVE
jgi:ribosomal protein S12 methylthiotransferase